jgi:ATP phosphoribosyltransferase regulatory subunit
MTYGLPPGTRDTLPVEMSELRSAESALLDVFERNGYQAVATPNIEFAGVASRGGNMRSDAAFRFFDDRGDLLALRSDMTVSVARLAADRFVESDTPIRLAYSGSVFRVTDPKRGEPREVRQVGVELYEAPESTDSTGTAEVIGVLVQALDAVGLDRAVIGLGNSNLFSDLMRELGYAEEAVAESLERLSMTDLVGLRASLSASDAGEEAAGGLLELANLRGGEEALERAEEIAAGRTPEALSRLQETYFELEKKGLAERVTFDFGLLRDPGYYTGAVFEVYDPALGRAIGGGGRYDGLMPRFGSEMRAAGFSLYLERLHTAQTATGRSET